MTDSDDELRAHAEARVGTVLRGKYTVERVIGTGGMASVYAALHRNGRRVALKLLHPELSIRADLRKRFLREALAANAVKHPGVVAIIDDDVAEDGAAFLVMELLEGENVEELWETHDRKLPTNTVLTIASDLCAVLAVAHEAGVVHRDLKPANLFVTREAELKVLDFGIARVRDEAGPRATQTGTVFGTPAFMAPEQAGGLVNELGPLTDIWAVGATMFTLLTGRSVHEGQSAQHIVILAATTPAPSLASVMPDAPPDLVTIVDRALALKKEDRWESAAAMRSALSDVLTRLTEEEITEDETVVRGTLSETMLAVAGVRAIRERSGTLESPGNKVAFLGGTSQPVSSAAITEKIAAAPEREPAWKALRRWVSRPQFRDEDGAAVSSDAPTRRRFSRKQGALGVAVAVASAGIAAVGVSLVIGHTEDTEAIPSAVPSKPAWEEPTAAIVAPEPVKPVPAIAAEPAGTNESVPVATLPASEVPPRPATSVITRGTRPPAAKPRPIVSATPPRLNCSPPFTIQDGIQVHKPGCP